MPGVPITDGPISGGPATDGPVSEPPRPHLRPERLAKHKRRLLVRRIVLSALIVGLSTWLAAAAQSPTSGLVERLLLWLLAVLLPLHLVFWQLDGIRLLDRGRGLPKPLKIVIAYTALGSSPMVLYPLGAIAIVVALVSGGGAATPALAVSGLLMLSPIFAIVIIALMFMASGYKGG